MEWDSYKLDKEGLVYKFCSEGHRGKIAKVIRFQEFSDLGRNAFNLAFGDLDEARDKIDDKVISNNGDQLKIIHTVAQAIIDFFSSRPRAFVLIWGSSHSRTRLYQMRIARFWAEVSKQFEILGEFENEWLPFQKGVNYKRFLIYKK
ncbi:MAG TPA: hypothetical protein VGN00_03620 [Puia sp.]|jgi:hypothetical protein